jgi:hypothetical protein
MAPTKPLESVMLGDGMKGLSFFPHSTFQSLNLSSSKQKTGSSG